MIVAYNKRNTRDHDQDQARRRLPELTFNKRWRPNERLQQPRRSLRAAGQRGPKHRGVSCGEAGWQRHPHACVLPNGSRILPRCTTLSWLQQLHHPRGQLLPRAESTCYVAAATEAGKS